jgi:hypothetical protein
VHKYMADQHSCKLSDLQVKYFLSYAWTSWKLQIYTKSRAITLTKLGEKSQMHSFTVMLIIIPVKLVDSNSSTRGTNNTT